MTRPGTLLAWLLATAVLALVLVPQFVPPWVESRRNLVHGGPAVVPEAALRLHDSLTVVDLHVDSLLWNRDISRRSRRGHLDLPRMLDGNMALAVFSIVSKTPSGLNLERNDDRSDDITLLSIVQGLPPRTWFSLRERVLYHAGRLRALAADPANALRLVRNRRDLKEFVQARRAEPGLRAAVLAVEGAQVLEGRLENLDVLQAAGIRVVGLTHFFDNEVGGSAHGVGKGGLTAFGRALVPELERRGMVIDLAHASLALVDDVLDLAAAPVMVSHGGVQATCPGPRNLDDDRLRRIAATGGLLGIGLWPEAVCGKTVEQVVRAMQHAVTVMGEDHVALGTDFDGSVSVPFDASALARLTAAMLGAGFSHARIEKIMGRNALGLLARTLPPEEPAGSGLDQSVAVETEAQYR